MAQEQFSEYLTEKAADGQRLLQRLQQLEGLLTALLAVAGRGGAAAAAACTAQQQMQAELSQLREELEASATDADATAKQLREESARLAKRSSSQVRASVCGRDRQAWRLLFTPHRPGSQRLRRSSQSSLPFL